MMQGEDAMAPRKPRVGPWLRHYGDTPSKTPRQRALEIAMGLAAGVLGIGVVLVVLWAFLRAPLLTFGALVAVWMVGFAILMALRRRERLRERLERRRLLERDR